MKRRGTSLARGTRPNAKDLANLAGAQSSPLPPPPGLRPYLGQSVSRRETVRPTDAGRVFRGIHACFLFVSESSRRHLLAEGRVLALLMYMLVVTEKYTDVDVSPALDTVDTLAALGGTANKRPVLLLTTDQTSLPPNTEIQQTPTHARELTPYRCPEPDIHLRNSRQMSTKSQQRGGG